MGATVLVVDDDAAQLNITETMLAQKCHYRTISALGGRAAIERLLLRKNPEPDIILLDLIMPDVNGVEVVRAIRRSDPHIPIVLLAPTDQNALVMEAIQAGANDSLRKPVNLQFLKMTLDKQLQREAMRKELCRLSRYGRSEFCYDDVVGSSKALEKVTHQAKELTAQAMPICFEGEEGVGKELFARIIHSGGAQAEGDFAALSCREPHRFFDLLGQGAQALKNAPLPFAFSKTKGGTLFLRHIEALSLIQQEALAAFLLGMRTTDDERWMQVRFMASALEPLGKLYRQGALHEKLYFYFSNCCLFIPPLRERAEDVEALCEHYLQRFTATQPYMISGLSAAAVELLRQQEWRGNVAELIGLMQRASYQTQASVLDASDLRALIDASYQPSEVALGGVASFSPGQEQFSLLSDGEVKPIEQLEAEIIRFAIEHYSGKMTEVAKKLGIGRSTLYRKMQDYKLRDSA